MQYGSRIDTTYKVSVLALSGLLTYYYSDNGLDNHHAFFIIQVIIFLMTISLTNLYRAMIDMGTYIAICYESTEGIKWNRAILQIHEKGKNIFSSRGTTLYFILYFLLSIVISFGLIAGKCGFTEAFEDVWSAKAQLSIIFVLKSAELILLISMYNIKIKSKEKWIKFLTEKKELLEKYNLH